MSKHRIELLVLRKQRGMSQREAAEAIGLSQDSYSRIETGKSAIVDVTIAQRISKLFDVGVEKIFPCRRI